MTLQDKLRIIQILFCPCITNPNSPTGDKLDYEDHAGYTRAYGISVMKEYDKITKSDLKYINIVCKNLIDVLKLNKAKINTNYVYQKLQYSADRDWMDAYKELIDAVALNQTIP